MRQKFEAQGVNVFFIGALVSLGSLDARLLPRPCSQRTSATEKTLSRQTSARSRSARPMCASSFTVARAIAHIALAPQYQGWNPDDAVKDYMGRIAAHAKRYETMETSGGPFVKIYNIGERLVVNNIRGYLQSRIVFFLMNVHHKKRTIWFARVRSVPLRSWAGG